MKKIFYTTPAGTPGQVSPVVLRVNSDRIPPAIFGLSRIPEFNRGTRYRPGDLFLHEGILYRALKDHLGWFTDGTYWATQTSLYQEILAASTVDRASGTITLTESAWDAIESDSTALKRFLSDYTGYTLDIIEDYDHSEVSMGDHVSNNVLWLYGGPRVTTGGVLTGISGRVPAETGRLVLAGTLAPDPPAPGPGEEEEGSDVTVTPAGILTGLTGRVSAGVLGPISGRGEAAGILMIT